MLCGLPDPTRVWTPAVDWGHSSDRWYCGRAASHALPAAHQRVDRGGAGGIQPGEGRLLAAHRQPGAACAQPPGQPCADGRPQARNSAFLTLAVRIRRCRAPVAWMLRAVILSTDTDGRVTERLVCVCHRWPAMRQVRMCCTFTLKLWCSYRDVRCCHVLGALC